MKITDPVDGMPANGDTVFDVVCPCGGQVDLWYNGEKENHA